jgi:hypothetical protein
VLFGATGLGLFARFMLRVGTPAEAGDEEATAAA